MFCFFSASNCRDKIETLLFSSRVFTDEVDTRMSGREATAGKGTAVTTREVPQSLRGVLPIVLVNAIAQHSLTAEHALCRRTTHLPEEHRRQRSLCSRTEMKALLPQGSLASCRLCARQKTELHSETLSPKKLCYSAGFSLGAQGARGCVQVHVVRVYRSSVC